MGASLIRSFSRIRWLRESRPGTEGCYRMSNLARLALIVGAAALGALGVGSGTAAAHTDPCHPLHTCPSDHHSYVWTDANRVG